MLAKQTFHVKVWAMKQTTPAAMPPCFDRWCKRFDDIWTHQAQKREFRNYIGRLLGESERKNLSQMVEYPFCLPRVSTPSITARAKSYSSSNICPVNSCVLSWCHSDSIRFISEQYLDKKKKYSPFSCHSSHLVCTSWLVCSEPLSCTTTVIWPVSARCKRACSEEPIHDFDVGFTGKTTNG